jgi:thiol-disulfide isomerase/thioredoxin
MEEKPTPTPPSERRFSWKTLIVGAFLGIVIGAVGLAASILGAYAFFQKESVAKMAETKELEPLLLRADFDWSVKDLDGNATSLKALSGQPSLLHFWKPSCVSCVAEIPSMNELYEAFGAKGLNFAAIALQADEDLAVDVAEHGVRFPVYSADLNAIPPVFKIKGTPTTFVIDRDGLVILKHAGAVDWSAGDIGAYLDRLFTE